jgi:uncharacterized protein (TIGR02757 family)
VPRGKIPFHELKGLLDQREALYNRPAFIENDPISVPHRFRKKQDIEIAALFAAVLAWGQRATVISKCNDLLGRMDNAPHDFLLHAGPADRRAFRQFKHRTFNGTDAIYFLKFLSHFYRRHASLEAAFPLTAADADVAPALAHFHHVFFALPAAPGRTRKHVSTPNRKSACKRLNMFLRWMVRTDNRGVDFGLWRSIHPRQLICPCDVHVVRVAKKLGLIHRTTANWPLAEELTRRLRAFDPDDPVKYDFALFGLGAEEGWR